MAVITVFDVEYRKFSGWDEPQYPTGYWRGGGLSLGDATGGDHSIQIDFAKASEARNSQYYSLEQVMISLPGTGDFEVGMLFANFDIFSSVSGYVYTLNVQGSERNTAGLNGNGLAGFRRMWVGQQFTPNSSCAITLGLDNTNVEIFIVALQGYVWSARSTGVPGGPQRPPTGLYG